MYSKEDFYQLFKAVPLPYKIFTFPESGSSMLNEGSLPLYFSHKMTSDLALKVLETNGFHSEKNAMICHILIGRSFSDPQLSSLNDFQKCCHFSSTYLMGTKSELHNRMKELSKRLGKQVSFYPKSYYPPDDYEELNEAWPNRKYWIIKAPALSRAREIRVASSAEESATKLPYIVEEYITPPYLILGRKFDIRLYALISSINPLIIYFHKQGLVLFAAHKYQDENMDLNDLQMHLTNYEINKNSESFKECEGLNEKVENSKWSLPFLWKYFDGIGVDSKKLKKEIEDVAASAIIACMCSIRNHHLKNVKYHRKSNFEFIGVDILLDSNLKPYLLEINISPSMAGTSKLDEKIKLEVASDLYNIARILDVSSLNSSQCFGYFAHEQEYLLSKYKNIHKEIKANNNNVLNEFLSFFGKNDSDASFVDKTRDKAVIDGDINPWESPTFTDYTIIREFLEEQERSRGFHRAYPRRKNIKQFEKSFDEYNYEDVVLNQWLMMDKEKRFQVLFDNFDTYYSKIQRCYRIRDGKESLPVKNMNANGQKNDSEITEKNEINDSINNRSVETHEEEFANQRPDANDFIQREVDVSVTDDDKEEEHEEENDLSTDECKEKSVETNNFSEREIKEENANDIKSIGDKVEYEINSVQRDDEKNNFHYIIKSNESQDDDDYLDQNNLECLIQ